MTKPRKPLFKIQPQSRLEPLNLNGLLVIRQIDNISPGGRGGGARREISPWLSQETSDISAEEIRESGKSFQSLIVCGKKLVTFVRFFAS